MLFFSGIHNQFRFRKNKCKKIVFQCNLFENIGFTFGGINRCVF